MKLSKVGVVGLAFLAVGSAARGDEYPQWLGPQRDNVYREGGIVEAFPAGGLKAVWRAPVAGGYSQVAVAGGRAFVTDRVAAGPAARKGGPQPGVERVWCLDDATGKEVWHVEYECGYSIAYNAGPRATPTVDGERVYTLGAEGDLYCIDIKSGQVAWKKRVGGRAAMWGSAAAPLVEGDRVIVLSSGRPLLTAFDKVSGEVAWTALEVESPGYAPPTPMTLGGRRQIVQFHPAGIAGIDPKDGKVLWELARGPEQNGVTIVTPIALGPDTFAVASAYGGMGAVRVAAGGERAEFIWQTKNKGRSFLSIHPIHSQLVLHDGHVYGVDGEGGLICVDAADGKVVWRDTKPLVGEGEKIQWGTGFLTTLQPADGKGAKRFFMATDGGDLILCDLSPKGYREISRTHLLDPTNRDAGRPVLWCHPTYAHQSVYWRNDKEVVRMSLADGHAK
jgi:outer membrane protein assembly factor BamB